LNEITTARQHAQLAINDRQRAIVNRLLDGFEGKLTTVKWAKLEDVSHDTALRDIQELIELFAWANGHQGWVPQ
jgi:Fic family protein